MQDLHKLLIFEHTLNQITIYIPDLCQVGSAVVSQKRVLSRAVWWAPSDIRLTRDYIAFHEAFLLGTLLNKCKQTNPLFVPIHRM